MNARLWLLAALVFVSPALAADWPQWRGPNRDAKAAGFEAPASWPKDLTKKWQITIGDGVATPALVGDKLYTFSRQSGEEIIRCLNATDGKEIWQEKYPARAAGRPAQDFPGPRASPAVADGKVVTLGADGMLSCWDAATGKKVWQKTDFKDAIPRFFTSCSPLITDGICIVQVGGDNSGSIIAFDLASGDQKWKWDADGTKYSSPELFTAGEPKAVIAETAGNVVGISLTDGKLLWKTPFKTQYNASTPVIEGQTIIYSGPTKGTSAIEVEKSGDQLTAKELWNNRRIAVQFDTPVVKNGLVFGISDADQLFCLDAKTGKTDWTAPLRGGRRRGYGSVVDAGSVLFALTPAGELTVFEPSDKEFKKIASYPVGSDTFAYPVIADKRIFIKDKNDVTLWTIE